MVTLYNTYTRYTHAHYQEFIAVKFFARTGGNRNLAIIRPTYIKIFASCGITEQEKASIEVK